MTMRNLNTIELQEVGGGVNWCNIGRDVSTGAGAAVGGVAGFGFGGFGAIVGGVIGGALGGAGWDAATEAAGVCQL